MRIPKLDVEGNLMHLGLAADGTLEVPPVEQPLVPAWWHGSPRPGALGPAVITGHVDGGGKAGIFHRLDEVTSGDIIVVDQAGGGQVEFVVYRTQWYAKDAEAAKVSENPLFDHETVYGDTEFAEVRLITCGGVFRRSAGHYADNLVVFARKV